MSNPIISCACKRGLLWKAHRSVTKGVPVDAQQGKTEDKNGIENNRMTETYRAPVRVAFNLRLAFERNRVFEGLRFSSDGSAGRLVGLRWKLGCHGGSGAVRSDRGAASGFERQHLLIVVGFSCVQQHSGLQHSSILGGSAPVPASCLWSMFGAPNPLQLSHWGGGSRSSFQSLHF